MRLAIGLASGLGNAIFMLPTVKALKDLGHELDAFVQTDFPTIPLWKRCGYFTGVYDAATQPVEDRKLVMGQWAPPAWRHRADLPALPRFQLVHPYKMSEVESNLRIASYAGHMGGRPDVSNWCRKLKREPRYDIGIIPGSKAGVWIRKRYPGMAAVARLLGAEGARIAVIGTAADEVNQIPGTKLDTTDITRLPEALASCRILIGTDSGASHVGSSLGIPLLMLVTATCPRKATPIGPHRIMRIDMPCSPCQSTPGWLACKNWRCQEIDPEQVVAQAKAMIKETE